MSTIIKLTYQKETEKAYLVNNIWLPKSILDSRGLLHPYYQIKDWYISVLRNKIYEDKCEKSKRIVLVLRSLNINFRDLPKEVLDNWGKYWSDAYSSLNTKYYDYEPEIWGNDCREGNPNDYF